MARDDSRKTPPAALRIGVLIDTTEVPAWSYQMLESITKGDYATVEVLILDDGEAPPNPIQGSAFTQKCNAFVNTVSDKLYHGIVIRDNGRTRAFSPKPIQTLLPDTPILKVDTQKTRHTDTLPPDAIRDIAALELDVLVRVGFRILRGDVLTVAKYGVWSILTCDNEVLRGGPPAYWETMQNADMIGSGVQILNEELDRGQVIYRSFADVDRFSVRNTLRNMMWKSQDFIPRMLKRLHAEGDAMFDDLRLSDDNTHATSTVPIMKTPSPLVHFKNVLRKTVDTVTWVVHNKTNIRQWCLLFHFGDDPFTPASEYTKILPPKDRIWADPFIMKRDNTYYIFIEEMLLAEDRGFISVMEMDESGRYTQPKPIIKNEHHLSYPHVFEHEGETWMIPESSSGLKLSLYRCTEFPYQWEFVMNLMEGIKIVDVSLCFKDGYWWLYGCHSAHSSLDE